MPILYPPIPCAPFEQSESAEDLAVEESAESIE